MTKNPSEYGVLGITDPIDPKDVDFDVSRVNSHVSIDGTLTLERDIDQTEGNRDAEFGVDYKRRARQTETQEVHVSMQIDDSTEAYVALTSPELALYEWLLPDGYADDWDFVEHECDVRFHSAPIMYIEASRINAAENENRTQIGSLLEWLNGNHIAEPVVVTRAIAIVLKDNHEVELGERDPYPR